MTDDIERRLEQRAGRGEPTGADHVWRAARREADVPVPRRNLPAAAAAAAMAAALLIGAVAISTGDGPRDPDIDSGPTHGSAPELVVAQSASSLVRYDDCATVLDDLKEQALERVGPYGLDASVGYYPGYYVQATAERRFDVDSVSAQAKQSETNTQEAGVDEPDVVETDGEHLFDVRGGTLRVTDIGAARVTATVPLHLVDVMGAVLIGDRLVVFANEPLSSPRQGEAKVVVIDVSGRPTVTERLAVDGTLVDVRAVDDQVHLVTVSAPTIEFTYAAGYDDAAEESATAANKERIRASTLADWLPTRTVTDGDGDVVSLRTQLTDCADIRHPKEFAGFDQTTLVTLDLDDLSASGSSSVQASSLLVYGTTDSVYTATTQYEDFAGIEDTTRPASSEPHTDIHRFVLGDDPAYAGSGRVAGFVGDQFGLSEHDGYLRVASTTWEAGAESRVTVLRVDGGELVETGVVDGLGLNEDIQGVRFVGDLGYVVTFRRTDPLYVVDLRDPDSPRLAGKLQVPGYSEYLHPIADGLVLGVGVDGTDSGRLTGAAMSLFDVHDPAAPTRVDLEAFGRDTASKMADDHHAFTWDGDTRTAYVPVGLFAAGHRIEVVRVEDDSLTLIGTVWPSGEGAPGKAAFDRTVIVGDRLLSVSPEGIQVSDLDTLEPIAWVPYS